MGEMGWAALVAYAAASDDRIERYFLEVKSDVDLNTKAGRAKVAKFILGAANRDPGQVARRFGGHAVMLLGVGICRQVVMNFSARTRSLQGGASH
jgi:hypothetical protein